MENKTFERREDIPLQHRWATEDLYASDECWEQELQHMITQCIFRKNPQVLTQLHKWSVTS